MLLQRIGCPVVVSDKRNFFLSCIGCKFLGYFKPEVLTAFIGLSVLGLEEMFIQACVRLRSSFTLKFGLQLVVMFIQMGSITINMPKPGGLGK